MRQFAAAPPSMDTLAACGVLREKHVLLTHGGSHNWKQPDHFRLAYLPKMEELAEVMNRLRDFLESYRQK